MYMLHHEVEVYMTQTRAENLSEYRSHTGQTEEYTTLLVPWL